MAFSNSSDVRCPSIWSSTISPVRGTTAVGQSASPKLSSSLFRSRHTTPSILPDAHDATRSVYGREDLVPAPFHVCGPVRPPEDPGLEPDRSQFVELAAVEPAPVCVYQLHLLRKVLDVFHGKPSSRGPRLFRRPLNQFPYGFGEADRLGPFLDQPDRHRRERGAPVVHVQSDPNVLADIDLAAGQVLDQGHHAPLLPDHARHFRRGDLHQEPPVQLARLPLLHRELDPLDLVDAQDVAHDNVADLQVSRGVAELDAPRGLRPVEGGGIGRVDVQEPVGRTDVDDLADHRIAALREVAAAQRNHADEAIVLVPDAQLRREKLSAFAVRSGARFQPGATDGFARNDDRAKRPTALHWFLSLTHRFETAAPT